MRTIPTALQTHLDTGVTTLCNAWKITRRDLTVLGFTDHDRNLTVASVLYNGQQAFSGTELNESLGLSVDNQDIAGGIDSALVTEADIEAGEYDGALVEHYRVNWSDPTQYVLLKRFRMGEITRTLSAFTAEIRSLAADLDQPVGRVYGYKCDAVVGDARCGVDLDTASFKGTATVTSSPARNTIKTTGLSAFSDGWFDHGVIVFTSGANTGRSLPVKVHFGGGTQSLVFWEPAPEDFDVGDAFTVTAGCDLLFATCKSKFSNPSNFRGFPHMPDDSVIVRYPNTGDSGLDGGGNYLGAD